MHEFSCGHIPFLCLSLSLFTPFFALVSLCYFWVAAVLAALQSSHAETRAEVLEYGLRAFVNLDQNAFTNRAKMKMTCTGISTSLACVDDLRAGMAASAVSPNVSQVVQSYSNMRRTIDLKRGVLWAMPC